LDQGPIVDFTHVTYKARDGQSIPAYLALPGPAEEGPYPTIIDPHGGPWAEDEGRYFFLNQYFIDRGYAVLKPNFRGSTGYGDAFTAAGFEQWGASMQNDVIDGLDWMIDQNLADANKVCIHGGSYGGYVALVAAYKTPEKFRCAISFAGVSDLADLRNRWYNYRFGRLSTARLPKGEALVNNSPIENVKEMQLPLLIVHGDVDRSVMIEQSRNLAQALSNAGIEHQYIEQPNGDHFFSLQAHRLEYLQALDKFLTKHLSE
jgi:dipeptidyl aminopeptidase/acylaminoacyl peptidase